MAEMSLENMKSPAATMSATHATETPTGLKKPPVDGLGGGWLSGGGGGSEVDLAVTLSFFSFGSAAGLGEWPFGSAEGLGEWTFAGFSPVL
jgi:hypothetical protein